MPQKQQSMRQWRRVYTSGPKQFGRLVKEQKNVNRPVGACSVFHIKLSLVSLLTNNEAFYFMHKNSPRRTHAGATEQLNLGKISSRAA